MRHSATKIAIATLGLFIATAPLAANAASWFAVTVGGPGYVVRYSNGWRPYPYPYRYGYWRPIYYAPRPYPVYYRGYYWRHHWWHHRRWANGVWVYF